jgi:hypothetical protein
MIITKNIKIKLKALVNLKVLPVSVLKALVNLKVLPVSVC